MKSNIEQLKLAEKDLGESCRRCCSMANNCCCYFVSKGFQRAGNGSLFYNGVTVTYCPNAIKWCKVQLAQIPLYLAMPSDIIFFDWNGNNVPDHIGFVRERKSCTEIYTLEGNTSGGIVAYRTRPAKYVLGVFRPHFVGKYDISKPIAEDGHYGYSSIALTQKWLGVSVDSVLGRGTVKALQKRIGVSQDGSWGTGTSKALQKFLGVEVDGYFGDGSVKALQRYLNKQVFKTTTPQPSVPVTKPQTPVAPSVPSIPQLKVDGHIGKGTIIRMQSFFGTKQDGIISGQKKTLAKYYSSINREQVTFGDGGSAVIEKLQKWLGVKADGVLGRDTVKAWQRKIGVKADGYFGENSAKAWQRYLNTHEKPTITGGDKLSAKARELCWARGTNSSKYAYKGGSATEAFKRAINKVYPNRTKWSKAPRNGASCDVLVGTVVRASGIDPNYPRGFDEQIKYMSGAFQRLVFKNVTPYEVSQDGDIILYNKNKSGSSHHTCIRADGVIYEAQYEKTYGHVNASIKKKLNVKRPYVVILRAK